MRALGIVCEYNPFHNGHGYQLREGLALSGADLVICVMSGNYVQRGQPALLDKWSRAQMALAGGADLVVELPTLYAMSSASTFAQGAIGLLKALQVEALSFGAESVSPALLWKAAVFLQEEPQEYRDFLNEKLQQGESFARARAQAMQQLCFENDPQARYLLTSPGTMLGIEYLRQWQGYGSLNQIFPVLRRGQDHNDLRFSFDPAASDPFASEYAPSAHTSEDAASPRSFSSAGAIRRAIAEGASLHLLHPSMPDRAFQILREMVDNGRIVLGTALFENLLYARGLSAIGDLRQRRILADAAEGEEGLDSALIHALSRKKSLEELTAELTSRRYPAARIRRYLMNAALGITRTLRDELEWETVPYLKILGLNEKGQAYLHQLRKNAKPDHGNESSSCSGCCRTPLPEIVTNPGRQKNALSDRSRKWLETEAYWSDLYGLCMQDPQAFEQGREYRMNAKLRNTKQYEENRRNIEKL